MFKGQICIHIFNIFKEVRYGRSSISSGYYFNNYRHFFAGALGWAGAILAIIGIVLGALGKKNPESKGIATAGMVCSIIGLILCLLLYIACAACVGAAVTLG